MGEYFLNPGFGWNPLKKHRNLPCPCGSGLKIKRCHGQSETLPLEDIAKCKEYLGKLEAYGFIRSRRSSA